MDTIFTLGELENDNNKINLDELYEKKQQQDINTLGIYNKILNRIHTKIKHVSRQNTNNQFCWYVVPEMIIGIPKYNHTDCIAYIINKLQDNGLNIRYTHPNLIFISWKHWVPSYVRNEIKKKTGENIDGYGNKINKDDIKKEEPNINSLIFLKKDGPITNQEKDSQFKNVDTYKPSGNLIYNKDLLKKIEDKSKNN